MKIIHCVWLALICTNAVVKADMASDEFENKVRPVLVNECQQCHGPTKQHGGLRVDSRDFLLKGGDTAPAIVPKSPGKSLLIQALRHEGDLRMPPKKKLTASQIEALTKWIESDAPWPAGDRVATGLRTGSPTAKEREFWSFRAVQLPQVPKVKEATWPQGDIDHFILAKLEANQLKPRHQPTDALCCGA